MCGIAGITSLGERPVDPNAVKRMTDALAHRGPDDAGYALFSRAGGVSPFSDSRFAHLSEGMPVLGGPAWQKAVGTGGVSVALGHRRLAIIDPSPAGHQPFASADKRLWVCFNGEIYNFRELRAELAARGRTFRTATDTEVLLALWEEEGADAIRRLNGMFAFALFDCTSRELHLVRDRYGVKPLYWGTTGDVLVFGSESKALLASGELERAIDPASLTEYFTYQNVYGDGTLLKGIKSLSPGHILTVKPGSGQPPRIRRWSSALPAVDHALGENPALHERVAEAFSRAVDRQLVSDVEVGSFLSGGMDSGSIVAVAGRSIPRLVTFTAGFDLTNVDGLEQGFDERRIAEKLSFLLQTEHYDVVLHAGDMPAAMPKISWHMDDPRTGMCHQIWYVCKLASKFVKVCLAGSGGDELFGGYPWRYRLAFEAPGIAEFDRAYQRYWHRLLQPEELRSLFSPDLGFDPAASRASFDAVMKDAPANDDRLSTAENLLLRAFHFEYHTFMHGLLVAEDHISMAHGLEVRVPFLDDEFVDLAWRIPPARKLDLGLLASSGGAGHMESADGKRVLRQAMEKFLPPEFTRQKKQGFSPPDGSWYRGPSMDYIRDVLLDSRTQSRPWFDPTYVRRILEEHGTGKRNHRLLIWSLLSVEWLQRHHVDAAPAVVSTSARG